MSLRVAFDTNAIVSALLTPDGTCARLLLLVMDGVLVPVVDSRMLREYACVLRRPKFGLAPEAVEGVLRFLEVTADVQVALPLLLAMPDDGDLPFLEVAATAGACLVTGNVRHFPEAVRRAARTPASPHGVKVLSPADVLQLVAQDRRLGREDRQKN